MTDVEITSRLDLITEVWTPEKNYRNTIVRVEADKVIVRSDKRGSKDRGITFSEIRDAEKKTHKPPNSRIIMTFRRILGLPMVKWEESGEGDDEE
jgi:hypothetical protein